MKKYTLTARGLALLMMACIPGLFGCADKSEPRNSIHDDEDTEEEERVSSQTETAPDDTEADDGGSADTVSGKETETKPEPVVTDPVTEDTDPEEIYAPVFEEILTTIEEGPDYDKQYDYVSGCFLDRIVGVDKEEIQQQLGYLLRDINGDGIPELLIGENASFNQSGELQSYIYNVFSVKNGEVAVVFSGSSRVIFQWLGDGHFFYFGSSGFTESAFGECHVDDTPELVWDDFYFTEGGSGSSMSLYHNTSGYYDSAMAEELTMSEEDFWAIADSYVIQLLDWTTFSGETISAADMTITGCWCLRSYVDQVVYGYQMFPDGTWLALEVDPATRERREDNLAGTWTFAGEGADGSLRYDLYFEEDRTTATAKIYVDEYGDSILETPTGYQFYRENIGSSEIVGNWLFMNGARIEFTDGGEWQLYDDEDQWMFGGHYVIGYGREGIYLRMHSPFGDTGNERVADGTLGWNGTGYNDELHLSFIPYLTDFTGSDSVLNRAYE